MLYHLYLWLLTDYSIGKALAILALVGLIVGVVRIGGASLFRWALVPMAVMEWYFMSPGYACSYGGVFPRAQAMSGMCQGAPYQAYLNQNFGLHLWYIQALYLGLLLFAIWPLFAHIVRTIKEQKFEHSFRKEQAVARAEYAKRIDGIEKIGPM